MDISYYRQHEPIFEAWKIKRLIGEGNFGKVFEIEREEFGHVYSAALKTITIPTSQSEIKSVMADGMDEDSVTKYFQNFVEDVVNEIFLMSKLKGNSNIVGYEDHAVIKHSDEIGWDILIRMELLTPLLDHTTKNPMQIEDVICLGIDICKALELCQKHSIIHRDIKPENIFISENGEFKLGDFGIARMIEKTTSGLSKKGTYTYMAPEVYKGEAYGASVDIYSLGIVMYRLLNNQRAPFLPEYPQTITYSDKEAAITRRISGEPLPKPSMADDRLAEIVLKACAFSPKDRYLSPATMRVELERLLYKEEIEATCDLNISEMIIPQKYEISASQINEGDRTESVFGGKHVPVQEHEKTESVFSHDEAPSQKTSVNKHPAMETSKTRDRSLGCPAVAVSASNERIKVFSSNRCENTDEVIEENALYKAPSIGVFSWVIFEIVAVYCLLRFKDPLYEILTHRMKLGILRNFFDVVLVGSCVLIGICVIVSIVRLILSISSVRGGFRIRKNGDHLYSKVKDTDIPNCVQRKFVVDNAEGIRIKKYALTVFWPLILLISFALFFKSITGNLCFTTNFLRGNTVMLSYIFLMFVLIENAVHLSPYYGKVVKIILMVLFGLFQLGIIFYLYQHSCFEALVENYRMYAADVAIPERLRAPYGILRGILLDYLFLTLFSTTLLILLLLKNLKPEVLQTCLREGIEIPMEHSPNIVKTAVQVRWTLVSRCGIAVLLAQVGAKFAADAFVNSTGEVVTTMQVVTLLVICILWRIMSSFLHGDLMKALLGEKAAPCLKYALLTVFVLLSLSVRPVIIIWPYVVLLICYLLML